MAKKKAASKSGRGLYERKEGVHKVSEEVSRLAVVIPKSDRELVDADAQAKGISLSQWLRDAVSEKLKRVQSKNN